MTERRPAPHHAVVLPAVCLVSGRAEFHAATVDFFAAGLRLRSATVPRVDTRLTCTVRGVGPIEASVASAGACDFVVRVTGLDPAPGEVARRLIELARQQAQRPTAVRVERRIVPMRQVVRITLADGTGVPAQIVNLSASGVALWLDVALADGQEILVGRHPATVARQIEGGVGAAFLVPLDGAIGEHTVL